MDKFRFTSTQSGLEAKGSGLFGLDGESFVIPLGGLIVTIVFVAGALSREEGVISILTALLPFGLTLGFSYFFFHNRPPRFMEDWIDGLFIGRAVNIAPRRRLKHPIYGERS
jgi:hypothetical protein